MMNPEEKIEQLWYTWSDVGLGNLAAGFRIRAVSPSLVPNSNMIYSDRMRGINRYTSYDLPSGTDPAIAPASAPISLIYAHITWKKEAINVQEGVLVQKKYRGGEGLDKRYGNFFSHLYSLGTIDYKQFSAEDAVWLWGANIWQENDRSLPDRRSTKLDQESLHTLIQAGRQLKPDYRSVSQYLPFFIEAYLTRKPNEPIYVAARADTLSKITSLLAGLTCCIPLVLFKDLTFSTFESDIMKATTQIIGTSWVPGQPPPPDFTPQLYRDKLALNCDTGECSLLDNHPRVTNSLLARQFAHYATNWLLTNSSSDTFDDIDALLKRVDLDDSLTVEGFLKLFREEIQNIQITREKIITYLNNPIFRIEKLSESGFRNSIINFVIDPSDRSWYEISLRPLLAKLHKDSAFAAGAMGAGNGTDQSHQASAQGQGPRRRRRGQTTTNRYTLSQVLSFLATDASREMVGRMLQVGGGNYGATMQDTNIGMLLDLVESCLPDASYADDPYADDPYKVWPTLLQTLILRENQAALAYLTVGTHQNLQFRLLRDLNRLSSDVSIGPLLVFPWSSLGEFLKEGFRKPDQEWNIIALTNLIQSGQELTPQTARSFGPYQPEIIHLFTQLTSRPESLPVAGSFAALLLRNGYPGKLDYVGLLGLLVTDNVFDAAKDLAIALIEAGKGNNAKQQLWILLQGLLQSGQGMELFDLLVKSGYFPKESLVKLLLSSPASQHNLRGVLERVYQIPSSELASFFVKEGRNYLASDAQRRDMLDIFVALLRYPEKLRRLEILLNASMDETYVWDLLQRADLIPQEQYVVLSTYGKSYLEHYKQAPTLAHYVVSTYTSLQAQVQDKKKFLLAAFTPNTDPKYVKTLLQSLIALTLPEQREFLDMYGTTYAEYYSQIPKIQKCLTEYVKHLTASDLKDAVFLKVIGHNYKFFSPMEDNVQNFMTVYRYIIKPSTRKKELNDLAAALFYLDLPNYSALMVRLAQAFVGCIGNVDEMRNIIEIVETGALARKINKEQLLYAMAEQYSSDTQASNKSFLVPCIFYILTEGGVKIQQKHFMHEDMHFTTVLLNMLLHHYQVTNLGAWKEWNEIIKGWQISSEAISIWRTYLQKLELLGVVEGQGAAGHTASKGSKPTSTVVASQPKAPNFWQKIWGWLSSKWPWGKKASPPNPPSVAENGKAPEGQAPQHGLSANQQSGGGQLYLPGPSSGTRNPSQSPQSPGQSWGLNEGGTQNNRRRGQG